MDYSIGQVAESYDLSVHTLRFYEKEGLLPNVKRTRSGIRKFDESSLNSLKIVECLKKSGMPLKDIRQFLDWCQEGDATLAKRRDMFRERRATVLAEMAELRKVLDVIEYKCWYYETAAKEGTEAAARERVPPEMVETYNYLHQGIDAL